MELFRLGTSRQRGMSANAAARRGHMLDSGAQMSERHPGYELLVRRRGRGPVMALLSSLSATVQEPSEVRFAYQSSKLVRPRLVPMLRVVDGGGGSEPREQSGGQDNPVEPAIPPHGDEAAMRDLMRSAGTPRTDPLADLAARATHGDVLAMRELLRSVANSLLAAVRAVVGRNAPDVEDIAQETMVAFVQALPAFRGECSVNHYVSRIAVRTAVAARKRRIVRENRADSLEDDGTSEPYAASPGDEAWAARRRSARGTSGRGGRG